MVGPLNSRRDRPALRRAAEKEVDRRIASNWIGTAVHCPGSKIHGTVMNAWRTSVAHITGLCIELPDLSVIVSDSEKWIRREDISGNAQHDS